MKTRPFILGFSILTFLIISQLKGFENFNVAAQTSNFPAVIHSVAPVIPYSVAAFHITGVVTVEASLNSKGNIESISFIQGHPMLRQTTEEALKQWKFAPAKLSNRKLQISFDYRLSQINEIETVTVLPYQLELKTIQMELSDQYNIPDSANFIPADWHAKTDKCKIHGKLFKKDKVEIIYGLTIFSEKYFEAQEKVFPHANAKVYGGCVRDIDAVSGKQISPQYAEVLYCPKCRKAQKEWSKEHKHSKFY